MARGAFLLGAAAVLTALLGAACSVEEIEGPTSVREIEGASGTASFYITYSRRRDATVRLHVVRPAEPVATVLLFMGGAGKAHVGPFGARSGNFLVRSQRLFADAGLASAVIDAPRDRGHLNFFRHSEAHAIDIKGAIAELRKLVDAPVWAVGHSAGAASVANVASRYPPPVGPDGVVFASAAERTRHGSAVFGSSLDPIQVPALIVHHRQDACRATPFQVALRLEDALTGAPVTEVMAMEGGGKPYGDPCDSFHKHGFIGQEWDVVKGIADWIKAHSPQ